MINETKPVIRKLYLALIFTAVLLGVSLVINHLILLFGILSGYSINSLSATVYTFVFCPIFVGPIGFIVSFCLLAFVRHPTTTRGVAAATLLAIPMTFLLLHWFPMEPARQTEEDQLMSFEELLEKEKQKSNQTIELTVDTRADDFDQGKRMGD